MKIYCKKKRVRMTMYITFSILRNIFTKFRRPRNWGNKAVNLQATGSFFF